MFSLIVYRRIKCKLKIIAPNSLAFLAPFQTVLKTLTTDSAHCPCCCFWKGCLWNLHFGFAFFHLILPTGMNTSLPFSSVQFSHSVVSDSLWPHELQQARPPCPSPTPGVHSNSLPSSRWCHPAILFSVVPFSSCPQSLPASESFPMSQLFTWGGQSIGVSSFSISPSNEHPGLISFRMDWLDLLAIQGTLNSLL